MRALLAVTMMAAIVAASITPKKTMVSDFMLNSGNSSADKPTKKWHYNYFGGDFEPLVLESINLLFIPVNFQADGSAIFAINLDNGYTNYTMSLNYVTTSKMWGPGQHSFDPNTNYLYLTNTTDFICIDAITGTKIWVTPAPSGVTSLGLGEVAVAGNGLVYYSGQGYTLNGESQVTILYANNGTIASSQTLWSGTLATECQNDAANAMGPRPLYENTNDTTASRLLFACGGCIIAAVDITGAKATKPAVSWASPLDNCNATQVPRGGYTVSNQFDRLVYQWNGNNLTAIDAKTGAVQWDYKLPSGAIINAPAVDTTGNLFLAHIDSMGHLQLQKLGGIRRAVDWTWSYNASNSSVVDYHVVYDDSNQLYVTLTTSTPGSASKGTSYMCGVDARTGSQGWCTTVVNPAQGTPKSSRVALSGPYVVVASSVDQVGTPYSSGTITTYKHMKGTTPAPEGGIILTNCTGANCNGGNCKTEYPTSGCNAGDAPGSSVLYFCEGGNTLLYAQYFTNSTTCSGLPSSAEEYGVGVCHPMDQSKNSILVTHCSA